MTRGPQGREGGLDPQAEATLRAFRAAEEMPAAAQARVWARLAESTAGESSWPKRHVHRSRSEWTWAALAVAAAAALLLASRAGVLGPLVGARGGEAAVYVERQEAAETEPVRAVAGADASGPMEHVETDMPEDAGDERDEPPSPTSAPGRASEAKSEPRARPRGEPASSPAEGSAGSLAQEAEALMRAQAAIQRGRAEEALAVLAAYAQQFPRGALREEHDALRALALCAGDRASEGRAAAQAFLATHGGSALAERVREGCPGE